ncbi:MAG: BON domain-containing protein [Planctomycetota bacterium]
MAALSVDNLFRVFGIVIVMFASASLAEAQQASGGSTGQSGGPAASQAAAADAGQQLTNQNLFSDTGDGGPTIGSNQGRFATSVLQNAPTATSTGNAPRTTQNFNRLLNGRTSQRGGGRTQFGRTQAGRGSSTKTIRPSLRLGFTPPARPSADLTRSVERRFDVLSARIARLGDTTPAFRGVRIHVRDAGQVTLTGDVASAAAARLAANIIRMEAGVRSVQNDLTVAEK